GAVDANDRPAAAGGRGAQRHFGILLLGGRDAPYAGEVVLSVVLADRETPRLLEPVKPGQRVPPVSFIQWVLDAGKVRGGPNPGRAGSRAGRPGSDRRVRERRGLDERQHPR